MSPMQLQVSGGTLHGERRESRYPDAPVLIALHAEVADSRSWSAMFDLLEGMPTLVAYDRRGYGASPLPDAGYDSLDDLASVLNQTASERVWVLGNSIGGRLALDLAVTHAERVAGLILLSPGVSGAPEKQFDETPPGCSTPTSARSKPATWPEPPRSRPSSGSTAQSRRGPGRRRRPGAGARDESGGARIRDRA
jgi:pimeloyl-ACP methyl ester carboxylesterase